MFSYPDEETLVARGKYSTLNREWHEQVKRVQDACRTIQGKATLVLSDCQKKPPETVAPLAELDTCVKNVYKARERLYALSEEMKALEVRAWGVSQT